MSVMHIVLDIIVVVAAAFWIVQLKRQLRKKTESHRAIATQLEVKNGFLALASHEIRGPLSIVIGFADLISEPGIEAQEMRDFASTIKRNGEQLLLLLNNVLDYSKIESGRIQLDIAPFSLCAMLEEVVSSFKFKAQQKGIHLDLKCSTVLETQVHSDATRVKQVLWNLLSNALKFTEKGHVQVSAQFDGSNVEIDIEDTGIGLTPEQQKIIFMPFTQADETINRRFGGTGLGLSLAQEIALILDGSVKLKTSKKEKGSTFSFKFPSLTNVERFRYRG